MSKVNACWCTSCATTLSSLWHSLWSHRTIWHQLQQQKLHEDQTLQIHHAIAGIPCKCWLDTRFEPNPLHVFKNVKDERLRLSWSPFEYIFVPKLWHFLYSKIFSFLAQLLTFLPTGRDELEVKTERKENLHTHSFLVQQLPDSDW